MHYKIMIKKKLRKINYDFILTILIILLVLVIIFFSVFIFSKLNFVEKNSIFVSANLTDKVGFDVNSTALTFGNVVVETYASRKITLDNNLDSDVLVTINSRGDISEYLSASENELVLISGEEKMIEFYVYFPEGSKYGNYEGVIEIESRII